MKKVLSFLVVSLFFVSFAFAGVSEIRKAFSEKDYKQVISLADEVIADTNVTDLDRAKAYYYKGLALYHLHANEEAILSCHKKAVALVEDFASAWGEIGNSYMRLQDYKKALNAYKKAREKGGDIDLVDVRMARCYLKMLNYEKAKEKVYTVLRNSSKAYLIYACLKILSQLSTKDEVSKWAKSFCERHPEKVVNYPKILDFINFASMTDEEVIEFYKKILRATPATEKNAKFLGRIKSEIEKLK